jgi:putative cell wall-binding protein/protocatechuate 3,4-dioxygenase beta subunit
MSGIATPTRSPLRLMLAAALAITTALAASVLGATLPASAAGAASISGTVTSALDGSPIAGATVELYGFDGSDYSALGSYEAEADGSFVITSLAAGQYTLGFADPSGGHLRSYYGPAQLLEEAALLTLAEDEQLTGIAGLLQRGGGVIGTVTDVVTGEPVEGVEVRGSFFDDEGGWVGSDVTGPDGTYLLEGLRPGDTWLIYFDAAAAGYAPEYYDDARTEFSSTPVAVTAGQLTEGIDAALDPAAFIGGTVELASAPGVGVEGAEIWLFDEYGIQYTATTDTDGVYSFGGLPPGSFTARASASNAVAQWWNNQYDANKADPITVAAGGVVGDIDFTLSAGGTISGVITGPTGDPIEGAIVEATPVDIGTEMLSTSTDASGSFVLTGVVPAAYYVRASPPMGENLRAQYYPGADTTAEATEVQGLLDGDITGISMQLPIGAMIAGTVTEAPSGAPIENIEVAVSSETFGTTVFSRTDVDGDWTVVGLPEASDYVVEFLDYSGTFLAEFYDDVIEREQADLLTVTTGEVLGGIDAVLTRSATISGRVVDGDGVGIDSAEVWLAPESAMRDRVTTFTDPDGYYRFTGLRPGEYRMLTGALSSYDAAYRGEWFDSAYDPFGSSAFTLEAGDDLQDVDVALQPNDDPQLPQTPTLTVDDDVPGSETVTVGLPSEGPTPYGALTLINFGLDGDALFVSAFDEPQYSFATDWNWYDGHALVTSQTLGSDGYSPAVRTLVEVGDGPEYAVRPDVRVDTADGGSAEVSWRIPTGGEGVELWFWDLYTVDRPGEPYVQSGFAETDSPFAHDELIGGLEPGTEYELFVFGLSESGRQTYWGRTIIETTAGPAVPGLTSTPVPTIAGGPRLGTTLTATTGTWGPAPVSLQVQWLRDGAPIIGANALSYTPTAADLGTRLSVRVTGSKSGYLTSTRTSLPTRPVVDLSTAQPERLAGADRFGTAAAISAEFAPGVPVVYLATGRGFPDALSAASAAATLGGPLLITERASIPSVIAAELQRLDPATVVIVGGTGVVAPAVEDAVRTLLPAAVVERNQGADRYATSRAIARGAFEAGSTPVAYIATGRNFPDALAASAAAGAEGAPVILVDGARSTLDSATRALLVELDVQRVFIAGGSGVVSAGVEAGLRSLLGSADVTRLAGADRYLTAAAINDARFGYEPTVYLATGRDYPDALAGAALAGRTGAPLYVVPGTCVPSAVLDGMARHGVERFVKFGGAGVLTAGVEQLTQC